MEVLHLDIGGNTNGSARSRLVLPSNTLPHLRELHSSRDIVSSILESHCDTPRPLETIKGVRLSGLTDRDREFLLNLRHHGKAVKRIELAGWNEMEDIRKLAEYASGLTWLDIGKKVGVPQVKEKNSGAPVNNTVEWASLLSALPDLTTFHGVRFFYEVSPIAAATSTTATSTNITMTDRSRIRKNDEIASVLAWKCTKLRRVDHWEEGAGKIVVLVRDGERDKDKVKWEVRRLKQ